MPSVKRTTSLRVRISVLQAKQIYLLAELSDPSGTLTFAERCQRVLYLAVRELLDRAEKEIPAVHKLGHQGDPNEKRREQRARRARIKAAEQLERQMLGDTAGRRVVSHIPLPRQQRVDPNRLEAARLKNLRDAAEAEANNARLHANQRRYEVTGKRAEVQGGLLQSFVQTRAQVSRRGENPKEYI